MEHAAASLPFATSSSPPSQCSARGSGGRRSVERLTLAGKSSLNASQIASMTFNNQDTVLLRAETDIHVCFLHDNRIFIFKKKAAGGDGGNFIIPNPNCDVEYQRDIENKEHFDQQDQNVEELCVSLILHLMTTPKYRLLNSTYIVFSTIDHWIFLSIVVMLMIAYGSQTKDDFSLSQFAWSLPVTIAVMLEIFVGITMNTSIYIVLLFYIIYYGCIALFGPNAGYSETHIHFLYVFLAFRFLAFSMSTLVDISIDMHIHNDLIIMSHPLPTQSKRQQFSIRNYLDIRHSMTTFPYVVGSSCYEGSLNSWTPFSIQYTTEDFLLEHVTNSKTFFSKYALYGGCVFQILITGFFASLLGLIVFTAVIAVVFVGLITDIATGRRTKGGFTNYVREIFYHF